MWSDFAIFFIIQLMYQNVNSQIEPSIQNVQVIHIVDITSYIVKSKYKITLKNTGHHPVQQYVFEVQDDLAFASFENSKKESLTYEESSIENSTIFNVNLNQPLKSQEEYTLKIKLIFPSKLSTATKFSKYDEEHSFLWRGSSVFYSRYKTRTYRFMFVTDPTFNRNTKMSVMYDSSVKNMYIYYAQNVAPYQYKELILTFTTLIPMFRVKKLSRSIYVSQFGKILVEDQVIVENAGPKLKGPYFNTQSDYWMYTHLPKAAESIKFFDILGNNSKTLVYEDETHKTLKFIPRYSLRQGGWKSTYTLQYKVPIYEYVFRDGVEYLLKIRAMDHILNDVVVESADIKIVFPDGAKVVSVTVPPRFEKCNDTDFYISLSLLGRQTVNLKGAILLEEHIDDVVIRYRYSSLNFLSVPFFIIFLVECSFFAIILWRRYSGKFKL